MTSDEFKRAQELKTNIANIEYLLKTLEADKCVDTSTLMDVESYLGEKIRLELEQGFATLATQRLRNELEIYEKEFATL